MKNSDNGKMTLAPDYYLVAGLVITTIKTTRSPHKPHIIFIANVLVTDIVFAIESVSVTCYHDD